MTISNLPARYEALAEKYPKLRVAFLAYGRTREDMWYRMGVLADDSAESLILAKLLAELPKGVGLVKHPGSGRPCIVDLNGGGCVWHPTENSDIEALLAYWEAQ